MALATCMAVVPQRVRPKQLLASLSHKDSMHIYPHQTYSLSSYMLFSQRLSTHLKRSSRHSSNVPSYRHLWLDLKCFGINHRHLSLGLLLETCMTNLLITSTQLSFSLRNKPQTKGKPPELSGLKS